MELIPMGLLLKPVAQGLHSRVTWNQDFMEMLLYGVLTMKVVAMHISSGSQTKATMCV